MDSFEAQLHFDMPLGNATHMETREVLFGVKGRLDPVVIELIHTGRRK